MRKRLIIPISQVIRPHYQGWLDLDRAAPVEVTSKEIGYGVKSALVSREAQLACS